jgi:flagellar motor switch protein FliN/FliY
MVSKSVMISNPKVDVKSLSDIIKELPSNFVEIKMNFETGTKGDHSYIIDIDTAKLISSLMMGQKGGDLTEASLSAVSEVMNTISGNALTTIGNQIKKDIRTSPPVVKSISKNDLSFSTSGQLVFVNYNLKIDGKPGKFFEIFDVNVVNDIAGAILPASSEMTQAAYTYSKTNKMGQKNMRNINVQDRMSTQVQNVQFGSFSEGTGLDAQSSGNINLLMDVTMDLTVELGRTKRSIKYILSMGEGTVLELDKLAGEPVDILVNGKLIARGEVVVIDENFGVRVTEIISPADRIQELT